MSKKQEIERIKIENMVSIAIGSVLSSDICDLTMEKNGVFVRDHKSGLCILIPFSNVVEIVFKSEEPKKDKEDVVE